MVFENLLDRTRGAAKAPKSDLVAGVGEDVIDLRGDVTTYERLKGNAVFLGENAYFILQTAIRHPVREVVVRGTWRVPVCVEVA